MIDWFHCPAVLTPKECKMVVKHAQKHYEARPATTGHGGTSAVNPTLRKSTVRWLDYADLDLLWLFRRLDAKALLANQSFGMDLQHSSVEWQFTEYDSKDLEHYGWHEDSSSRIKKPMDRKLTMIMQLTDASAYDGGKFELKGDPIPDTYFRNAGDVLFFRSALTHQAQPVTRGIRHSLVSWIHGPTR